MKHLQGRINTILDGEKKTEEKLQSLCQLLYDEIPHYNWVGFYFVNNNQPELKLGPYVGAATDHSTIPFGKGICGQVAISNQTFEVPDVRAEDNYLACSIETKAELVVPIIKNGKNIGQIDIDSHTRNPFDKDERLYLEELMSKIANIL